MSPPRAIAVALGDPNGIGPEIAVSIAASASAAVDGARLLLVGDHAAVSHYARAGTVRIVDPAQLPAPEPGLIDLVAVEALAEGAFFPGRCDAASGRATVEYVRRALKMVQAGQVSAIAACPHNETAVNAAGIPFSGYPGLVAELVGSPPDGIFLMLVGAGLRIVHATLHERLADALARLDTPLIIRAGRALHDALRALGIERPRIGLFGINPHAGEGGLFGDDDDRVSVPAAAALRREGIDVVGPQGADALLAARDCDGYVAAFHDQGHIPIKLLAGRSSAALTIGAGIVFASVGHGSAPDIAGRAVADTEPLRRTIALIAAGPISMAAR